MLSRSAAASCTGSSRFFRWGPLSPALSLKTPKQALQTILQNFNKFSESRAFFCFFFRLEDAVPIPVAALLQPEAELRAPKAQGTRGTRGL